MRIITSIDQIKKSIQKVKCSGKTIGLVPTMGALHEGHLSLVRRSRRENSLTIMSIFVNPIQFGPKEDFKKYPRPEKKDQSFAKRAGVDIIFYPSVDEMYNQNFSTFIESTDITNMLCGRYRPGHFKGVTTVVGKLLNIINPDNLYLGQKDAQQVAVIKKMVKDLNFSVKVKSCPTVREVDGLAMSSRNVYLSTQERKEAVVLYQSLKLAKLLITKGEHNTSQLIKKIQSFIKTNSSGKIQYIECVDEQTLTSSTRIKGNVLIALAVFFGKTRLIDNILVRIK